jgi:hypothetical protein
MTKALVIAGCLCLLLMGFALGREQGQTRLPGGGIWKSESSYDHTVYLAGFTDGYRSGILHAGSLAMSRFAPNQTSSMTPAEKKDYETSLALAPKVTKVLAGHSVSIREIETTVSVLYSDYRNISVCNVDAVILSAASLSGNPATEQELAAARKHGAEMGCR